MITTTRKLWPTQERGIAGVAQARAEGHRRICLTSPTGGGKSVMMCEMIADEIERGGKAVLYTNRKMLREQLSKTLENHGIEHGVRASGEEENMDRLVQVSSMQTEHSRVYRQKRWDLHRATLVLVDECHLQKKSLAQRIMDDHLEHGATVVGVTATPLDLGNTYETLVVAGTNSELRDIGALVRADHYGPDEPDKDMIGKTPTGEYEIDGKVRQIWTHRVFGRVLTEFFRLNEQQKPTILFAPGVAESLWFAEQFACPEKRDPKLRSLPAVPAAHIDGAECWIGGEYHKSSREVRQQILDGVKDRSIKVVCNRFVLREGIDIPELEHGILATVFGSLQSYIQSAGRLLRTCPRTGKTIATIQDHGGNWHRHGSVNADRVWQLGDTARITNSLRDDRLREKKEREPIVCPKCFACRMSGPRCWKCGFEHHHKSRLVIQSDGTLRERTGDIYRPHTTRMKNDTLDLWKQMFYRARMKGRTFKQAEALFFIENHYYPPRDLPLMPINDVDWYRPVNAVPMDRLT